MTLSDTQRAIEQRAFNQSAIRQDRALSRANETKSTGDTKAGRYFVTTLNAPLVKPMALFRTKTRGKQASVAQKLSATGIEAEAISFLTAKGIVNSIALSDKPGRVPIMESRRWVRNINCCILYAPQMDLATDDYR
ncbi:hypothetical protein GCM10007874_56910 [Labrys miyagiensis]|uniref:Uncharacterized protein n=1 Tax=Labrys miyagiensis TaxID=346912 RepID=A0ABQ6CWR2_9HYPH|nr:hypothetical protein [Labrys miyagiensis]GLS22671.1 hypothetical protein GCM10007874_56910 [Labrys miyagiensis]